MNGISWCRVKAACLRIGMKSGKAVKVVKSKTWLLKNQQQ